MNDFLQKTINLFEEGALVLDHQGRVLYMNLAAMEFFGVNNFEMVQGFFFLSVLNFQKAESDEKITDFQTFLADFQKTAVMNFSEAKFIVVKNTTMETIATTTRLWSMDDNIVLILKNINEEQSKMREQMEFISTASHEMRTPVAAIEGYLGLALNPSTATIDERAKKYLDSAHDASVRLGELFRDLLDVTELDDGRERVNFVPIELKETVRAEVEMMIPMATEKQLNLYFGEDRVESTEKTGGFKLFGGGKSKVDTKLEQMLYVLIDKGCLHEILANLIENGIKYTKSGGEIAVKISGERERARIVVSDTGIGIPAADLEKIFQKFYRVDNSDTREVGGTGLGLYIVKKKVELLHGKIWAESVLGEGTRFIVELPRLTPAEFERQKLIYENNSKHMLK